MYILYTLFKLLILLFSISAKPNVTKISSNQEVISNNAATFHCNATAKPIATFYWLKDGVELSNITRSQVNITYSTDGSNCNDSDPPEQCVSSSTVMILHTMLNDTGNYTCVAFNDYGNKSKSLHLAVKCM